MDYSELHCEVLGRVALLTIHRPERFNAWTPTLERELREAIAQVQADDRVRCAVLTGAGRAFCTGMDMDVLRAGTVPATSLPTESDEDVAQRYRYLWEFDKPLITAINGAAAGVGLCLALYCDLRFVAAGAKLTAPYARRGLAAEHGTAWLLPRLIGPMHAADLLLSGRTIVGEEADRMGLAKLLPADGFLQAVMRRANDMAELTSPRSVRIMKRQLREARYQTLGEATRIADSEIAACRDTDDFKEGVQHFLEKRPSTQFTGK